MVACEREHPVTVQVLCLQVLQVRNIVPLHSHPDFEREPDTTIEELGGTEAESLHQLVMPWFTPGTSDSEAPDPDAPNPGHRRGSYPA